MSSEKAWVFSNKLELPGRETPFSCRRKTITYACLNMVRSWNWESNREELLQMFPTSKITALAELKTGNLIVGDEEGRIWVKDCPVNQPEEKCAVRDILVVGPDHVIVEFKSRKKSLVNIKDRKDLCRFDGRTKVCAIKENVMAISDTKSVKIVGIDDLNCRLIREITQSHSNMRAEKGQFLLLFHDHIRGTRKDLIIWNIDSKEPLRPVGWNHYCYTDQFKNLVLIDSRTFILPFYSQEGMYLIKCFYSDTKKWEFSRSQCAGLHAVRDTIILEDYVMYTTSKPSSELHLFTKDLIHINSAEPCIKDCDWPHSLTALSGGSVAIEHRDSICIIKPQKFGTNFKRRLSTGEGDFSYTEAVIKKNCLTNPLLPQAITATEVLEPTDHEVTEGAGMLRGQGFIPRFNIKAESIQEKFSVNDTTDCGCPDSLTAFSDGSDTIEHQDSICIKLQKVDTNCKRRLFIGEGDFSYTEAVIKKHRLTHPLLPQAITASEMSESTDREVIDRVNTLRGQGVTPLFDVKAELIHEKFSIHDKFKRIHWNCPFGKSLEEMNSGSFKDKMYYFFKSCRPIQRIRGRIHVTLMQDTAIQRQIENPIVTASALNGYRLIKKRNFGKERYPGYTHRKTDGNEYHGVDRRREFVFEKVDFGMEYAIVKQHKIKSQKPGDFYFDCSTDEDSSDYVDSDSDLE